MTELTTDDCTYDELTIGRLAYDFQRMRSDASRASNLISVARQRLHTLVPCSFLVEFCRLKRRTNEAGK